MTLTLVATAVSAAAGERSGRTAFVSAWEGRSVVVKQTLYSLVYDERSRFLPLVTRQDRVAGLTVASASGTYYHFEARRDAEDDIIDRDPNRLVSTLQKQYYRSKHLEIGGVQDVQALMLVRYDPGVTFVVRRVQIERDYVRLWFHKDGEDEVATTLTVKWPVPLSKDLLESSLIDDVLSQFVTRDAIAKAPGS